jgi:hypothetical protein
LSIVNVIQLVVGNEAVRKEMIKELSTEAIVTCRRGATLRIQRNATWKKKEIRKSGQGNSTFWWRWTSTHNWNGDEEKYLVEMRRHT